jgi:hypothetical protein
MGINYLEKKCVKLVSRNSKSVKAWPFRYMLFYDPTCRDKCKDLLGITKVHKNAKSFVKGYMIQEFQIIDLNNLQLVGVKCVRRQIVQAGYTILS